MQLHQPASHVTGGWGRTTAQIAGDHSSANTAHFGCFLAQTNHQQAQLAGRADSVKVLVETAYQESWKHSVERVKAMPDLVEVEGVLRRTCFICSGNCAGYYLWMSVFNGIISQTIPPIVFR